MIRLRSVLRGSATALLLVMLATGLAVGQTSDPAGPEPRSDQTVLKASAGKDGVRVTVKFEGPLVAGEPAVVRTRVKNNRSSPVWWYWGSYGPSLAVNMPDATRRLGQPLEHFTVGNVGLKNGLFSFNRNRTVYLPFERHTADGEPWHSTRADVATTPQRIEPGEELLFVHRWDGSLHLEDVSSDIGLPPDGPVRLDAGVRFITSPDVPPNAGRTVKVRLETEVVGGWADDRLHPMEVVDVAMADRDFAEVMWKRDFGRHSQGMLWWDDEEQLWLTGTCTYVADDQPARWHLATVDPFTAEVQIVPDIPETKHCGKVPT